MSEIITKINHDAETRMKKSLDGFKSALEKIRTGRANAGLLEHINVEYYGSRTPLSQVASVSVADARTLTVTPWDKAMVQPIEKAIMESGLGLNPNTSGTVIRVPLPALSEERRKEFGKVVRKEGEEAKVAIRNVRRDALQHLKEALKKKQIAEDEEKRAEEAMQKLTDRYVGDIDKAVQTKEQELLAI
ncbi:MAG: ribosome recycling factor [Gammaproteobacteria bacterium]|nr:ribosome recycling factor [Gammaproteobacteria bacterium]